MTNWLIHIYSFFTDQIYRHTNRSQVRHFKYFHGKYLWLVNWMIDWLRDWLDEWWLADWLTDWFNDWLNKCDQLMERHMDRQTDSVIDEMIDWLSDWKEPRRTCLCLKLPFFFFKSDLSQYRVILKKVSFGIFGIIVFSKEERILLQKAKAKCYLWASFMIFGHCQNHQN